MLPTAINVRINSTVHKILAWFPYMEHNKRPSFSPPSKGNILQNSREHEIMILFYFMLQLLDTGKTFCTDYLRSHFLV